jgi:hypothetical protein
LPSPELKRALKLTHPAFQIADFSLDIHLFDR